MKVATLAFVKENKLVYRPRERTSGMFVQTLSADQEKTHVAQTVHEQ